MIWSGSTRSRYSSHDGSSEMIRESHHQPDSDDDNSTTDLLDHNEDDTVPPVQPAQPAVVEGDVLKQAVAATQYGRVDELTQLLDRGLVKPSTRDSDGCTLLQWAAINNRKDIVSELLARGANANDKGGYLQETALQWAVRQGALESIVELVHRGADPFLTGTEGMNALHLACVFKQMEALLYLCSVQPSLVDRPTDTNKGGLTPLMVLINHWNKPHADKETAEKSRNMIRSLIALGASINAQAQPSGDTALHVASRVRSDKDARMILTMLLEVGADTKIENEDGVTALNEVRKDRPKLRQIFLEHNLNKNVPGVLGFWAPWGQICAGASLTQFLGWMIGCASFVVACGALNVVAGATRKTRLNVQHGFASGSIFFILVSAYVYLFDSCSAIFIMWYIFSATLLVYYFVKTTVSDPGTVPIPGHTDSRSRKEDKGETAEMLEEGLRGSPSSPQELIIQLAERGELFDSQICCTCLIRRPPRSKHDPDLNRCVKRFDHYCPFVNTAVGENNMPYFLGFLFWCVVGIGSHLCVALPFIWSSCGHLPDLAANHEPDLSMPSMDAQPEGHGPDIIDQISCVFHDTQPALLVITMLACLHFLWITALGLSQLSQVMSDITTYEAIRGYRIRPQNGCKDGCMNLYKVLHRQPTAGPLSPMGTLFTR